MIDLRPKLIRELVSKLVGRDLSVSYYSYFIYKRNALEFCFYTFR